MKKLLIFIIIIVLCTIVSCSRLEDLPQNKIEQPKHRIIGKWESEFPIDGTKFLFEFQENNLLRIENVRCSGCLDCYDYEIKDDSSVEFSYKTDAAGDMMIMKVSVFEDNKLKTHCKNKNEPSRDYIIDAPYLCMGDWKFQRIQ